MKRKKSLLSLVMLVLVLILGVGYAVVSNVGLTIGGTATVAESILNVSFEGTTTTDGDGVTTASATEGSLNAEITVSGLESIGDTAMATYTIQNKETDLNADVLKSEITVVDADGNDLSEFFNVTTDVDSVAKTVEAENTNTVTVTVELVKIPIEDTDSTANITVKLNATPVQP